MDDHGKIDTAPLRKLLEEQADYVAGVRELVREIERRLGPDWWTLPVDEIQRVTLEIATSRGAPKRGAQLAEVAEGMILVRLFFARLDAGVPGIEHPKPREVWERLYIKLAEERHGAMPAFAARIAKDDLGLVIE
jgi:hypothetical protein